LSDERKLSEFDEKVVVPMLAAQFRRAALVRGFGHEDEDLVMQRAGIAAVRRTVQEFDAFGPDARLAGQGPLLEDPDPNVRVMAATCLVLTAPELALPVLEDLDQHDTSRASIRAMHALRNYRDGELGWINGED
jgi:hypothetical protein